MNKVYILLRREDWFYGDKNAFVEVFDSKESARNYFEISVEALLYQLELDYGDHFYDDIEISEINNGVIIYMEDAYEIILEIEEHDIMTMK